MQALSKRLPIILLTLVLAGSFTGQAGATSVEPILITGEENSNPNCADLGYGDFEVKFDSSPPLPGVGSSETYTDAFGNSITVTRTSDSTFNWTSTIGIDAVIVKAKNANVYVYDPESFGDSGLVTAAGPSGSPQTISHISFCYDYELTVSKTANATYNREWEWSIQKEAVPTLLEMFTGQSKSVTWNITVNKTGYTDSGFQASGSVTVTNNTPLSAGIASIVDTIDGVGVVPLTLTDDGNGDDILSPGEVWIYSYSTSLTDSSSRTNTVTVIDSLGGESVATADIVFGAPVLINDSVTIIDDRTTQTWLLAASDNTVSFEELLDCDDAVETEIGGEIKYGVTNTATIDETKQSAEAFVEIKCYELTVSKTAEGSYVKTHDWNITKTADPIEHNLFNGQEGTSDYSIEVIYGGFVNSDYEVISSITVTNNTPINAQISSIVDIFNGETYNVPVPNDGVLLAGNSVTIDYPIDLGDDFDLGQTYSNVVKVTAYGVEKEFTYEDVPFSVAEEYNEEVVLSDSVTNLGDLGLQTMFTAPTGGTVGYPKTFDCSSCTEFPCTKTYDNTATITGDILPGETAPFTKEDDASVTVNCYELAVSKTAEGSYTETHDWDITKTAVPDVHHLFKGQEDDSLYTIDVIYLGSSKSDYEVISSITVTNNTPINAQISSIVDIFNSDAHNVPVPDGGVLLAGNSVTIDYPIDLDDDFDLGQTYSNVVKVTAYGVEKEFTYEDVPFSVAEEYNEEVVLSDSVTNLGDLGLQTMFTAPTGGTVGYPKTFDCSSCTEFPCTKTYDNTATIMGDILPGETAPFTKEDDASVTVNCYELTVEKTADPEKTVFHDWDIEKTVSPEGPIYLNLEEETSYTWTITVTKISSEDMDWSVSGTITVENPAPIPVTITNIADELPGAQNLTFTPPDLPQSGDDTTWVEIAAGASQQWTYSADFLNGDSRSNSITVSILGSNETYQATVEFEFDESSITKEINESVVLTDDNELEGLLIEEVISTSPWTNNYPRIHECTVPGLEQKINTAVIALKDKEENDITKDSTAELDINCGPEVTINVEAIVTPKSTYQYAITKDVDPDHWDLFYGDQGVSNYTITVEQTYNPTSSSFIEFEFFGENDSVYAMKVYADTANSTLTPTDSGETLTFPCDADNPIDVLIGESWNCVATADNLIPGTEYTVDADFIVELYDPEIGITEEGYIGELTVEVSKSATATEVTNPSYVNVDDYFCVELPIEPGAILPPYDKTFFFDPSDSGTPFEYSQDPDDPGPEDIVVTTGIVSYPRDFDCFDNGGCDNIAYIRETGQSDDASVTVDCYEIVVTKDAAPDSEKKYDWSVTKSADASSLTLKPGQAYLLGYTVTLNKGVDEYYDLTGNITVDNPAPIDAVINSLADILDPAPVGGVTVDFGVSFPYVLPAGGQLNGTYSASWESEPEPGTNIATATRQNFKYESGEDPVPIGTTDISSDPPTNFAFNTPVYYEKYDLYDTMHDLLGSLWFISYLSGPIPDESGSYPETPKEFNYLIQIGPFTEEDCGLEYRIPNIAQLWSIDVGEPPYADPIELYAEAPWTVVVQLDCGCTLTQGYWKTHTKYNSPPRDDTWDELSEGEDTTFFLSGQSYYDVMWFKHQGNAYYILARQYIAATLNSLAGASVPAEVQEALGDATTFFETYVPSYFDKANLKGKEGKEVRDIANDAKSLAGLLDQYNNGLIGPGHCSEDYTSNNSD